MTTDFERSDVPPRLLGWLAAGFIGTILLVLAIVGIAFPYARHQQTRGPIEPVISGPLLQTAPAGDLILYQSGEQELLMGRAEDGRPIDRAMREIAQQGWRAK